MNFAPPTTGLYPGQEDAPEEAAAPPVDDGRPLTAQQRLAALKAKLSDARKTNHKAVVEEDRRSKLGPQGLKDEAKHKKYDQIKKEGKKETDSQKLMSTTAASAQAENEKEDKKSRNRGQYGWDVFNNEAQHRHYKKRVRRAEEDGRVGQARRSLTTTTVATAAAAAPPRPMRPAPCVAAASHHALPPEPGLVRRRTRTPTVRTRTRSRTVKPRLLYRRLELHTLKPLVTPRLARRRSRSPRQPPSPPPLPTVPIQTASERGRWDRETGRQGPHPKP